MNETMTAVNGTGTKQMKPVKAKTKRPVPFPLDLEEAQSALADYIRKTYGISLDVSKLAIQDGNLIVSGLAQVVGT